MLLPSQTPYLTVSPTYLSLHGTLIIELGAGTHISPPEIFVYNGDGSRHLWGRGRDMQVFTLTVLPTHPAQVPVLAKNVAVQGDEECP